MIDFIKAAQEAHRIFRTEGWAWVKGEGPGNVPAEWQIELELRRLAEQVRRDSVYRVRSGRLYADYDPESDTVEIGITHSLGME